MTTTSAALRADFDERYTELDGLLAPLTAAQLEQIGITDRWSVRDLLAHLVWWQQRMLARRRGEMPAILKIAGESDEAFWERANAAAVAAFSDRSGMEMLAVWRDSHRQMADLIASLSAADLADDDLIGNIVGNSTGHYEEHVPAVREFVARLGA